MDYFPFFFDLRGRRVLLVGGGEVAQRKAALLARAGAQLLIVAPDILPATAAIATASGGAALARAYCAADLTDCVAAVSATDDEALNSRVCAEARAHRVPVNVVDNPALCDFIFPALVERSPLVVAVSSGGASPVLARRVRAQIEALLPAASGRLAVFCGRLRSLVKAALPLPQRRLFWEQALDGAAAEAVLAGDEAAGEKLLRRQLDAFAAAHEAMGEVYLIGAGPGDPDLLTFRAHRLLQKADVVVYDRLVAPAVVELARRDAERIFVGKRRGCHAASQEQINAILISQARCGKRVARLKGGDIFIFGRGGEEMLALRAAGVPFQTAAGITAASGCAAAAGIPLTHRHSARGVHFCTAYRHDMDDPDYWQKLSAATADTIVFYMAGAVLPVVAEKLIAAGRAPETPAAIICAGTTTAQRVITGALGTIAAAAEGRMPSPVLIIVGEVAALCGDNPPPQDAESPFPEIAGSIDAVA